MKCSPHGVGFVVVVVMPIGLSTAQSNVCALTKKHVGHKVGIPIEKFDGSMPKKELDHFSSVYGPGDRNDTCGDMVGGGIMQEYIWKEM